MEQRTRVPVYFRDLRVQTPPEGDFDFDDIVFEEVEDRGKFLVAKIPVNRLADFHAGEVSRGQVCIRRRDKSEGQARADWTYYCYRGKLQTSNNTPVVDPNVGTPLQSDDDCDFCGDQDEACERPVAAETAGSQCCSRKTRRRRREQGQSVKLGCLYGFTVKSYAGFDEDACVIKFKPGRERHVDDKGVAIHEESYSNSGISDSCRREVYNKLCLGVKTARILSGELHAAPRPLAPSWASIASSDHGD